MDAFTARNALLTGALLIRRRPLLVLLWAALFLALTMVFAVTFDAYMGWVSSRYAAGAGIASLNLLSGAYAVARAVLQMILAAILWTSAFRAILRPGTPPSLRLGGEELLVLGARVITQIAAAVPAFAFQGALFAPHGLAGLREVDRPIMMALDFLGVFWSAVAGVWAFEKAQIAPLRCWTIARDRFWLLAGLVLGVLLLRSLAAIGIAQLATTVGHLFPPAIDPRGHLFIVSPKLQDAFKASALLRDILTAALRALEIVFLAGIVSSAYRARRQEPQAAATFSSVVSGPAS
ncbi:MAG TPA: hypothetical protein VGM25_00885 [Caulobacteraceae bacterium]|jgi:hypothetical protein